MLELDDLTFTMEVTLIFDKRKNKNAENNLQDVWMLIVIM